jgi:hypothetical protein
MIELLLVWLLFAGREDNPVSRRLFVQSPILLVMVIRPKKEDPFGKIRSSEHPVTLSRD